MEAVVATEHKVTVILAVTNRFNSDAELAGFVERAMTNALVRLGGSNVEKPIVEFRNEDGGLMRFQDGKGGWDVEEEQS